MENVVIMTLCHGVYMTEIHTLTSSEMVIKCPRQEVKMIVSDEMLMPFASIICTGRGRHKICR